MKYWQFVNWEPAPLESALKSRVTWAQVVANCFCNITVKPYKGRKYNPAFVWVCVG